MEQYIHYWGLPPHYRCDSEVNWTYDRWLQEGTPRVSLGIGTLIYGCVCFLLYIPCCMVLLSPDLRCVTAYKMLVIVAVCQMFSLFINSIAAGVFWIYGTVFCNWPHTTYLVGSITMLVWPCICITCLLLSTSRLMDLWSPSLHDQFFAGKKFIYSVIIIIIYTIPMYLYSKPSVFNSRDMAWKMDPLVYPNGTHLDYYEDYVTVANNEGTVLITLGLTVAFFISFAYKSIRYNYKMSVIQKQVEGIFILSTFSSMSSILAASIYVSFQFVRAATWYNYIGLLAWQLSSAGELTLFIVINKTIQGRVLILLGLKKKKRVVMITLSNQKTLTVT